jgi:NAD(P)-dependent dehydrogenase (short-subunit alcohol dehydrogenase family)
MDEMPATASEDPVNALACFGRLNGKSGLVTGASRGIGQAVALRLAAEGATVLACARGKEQLEGLVGRESAVADKIVTRVADVSDEGQVRELIAELERDLNGPDFVVNNAGVWLTQRLDDMTVEAWDQIEGVNIKGVLWGCKHGIAAMLRRGTGGSVVNVGSVNSLAGLGEGVGYTMTKHAVLGLTRSLASDREYAQAGVRVNCVCPGDVDTDLTREYWEATDDPAASRAEMEAVYPRGRLGTPEEVAGLVAFLVSDDASLLNGAHVVLDGGRMASFY